MIILCWVVFEISTYQYLHTNLNNSLIYILDVTMLTNNIHRTDKTWSRKQSKQGIICYERKIPKTYYMEYRANTALNTPFEKVVDLIKDISAYPEWMHNCIEAKELEGKDDFRKLIYYAQGTPMDKWTSDIILSATTLADLKSEKIIITLNSLDDHPYKHPNLKVRARRFRMPGFKGCWRLAALSKTSTMVSFTVQANPEKTFRENLINTLMQNICFNSLQGLYRMTETKQQSSNKTTTSNTLINELLHNYK
jgi:ribosome-associated toxin RatA of RatAB toxin-antitoxin module